MQFKSWRATTAIIVATCAGMAWATLPPPTDEAKAKAADAAAKAAWADKVGLYQLCMAMDRTADSYRKERKAEGKDVPPPNVTPACTDPGAYVPKLTPVSAKPLESSGAHSPPGPAVAPPSNKASAAELSPRQTMSRNCMAMRLTQPGKDDR